MNLKRTCASDNFRVSSRDGRGDVKNQEPRKLEETTRTAVRAYLITILACFAGRLMRLVM